MASSLLSDVVFIGYYIIWFDDDNNNEDDDEIINNGISVGTMYYYSIYM